MQSGSVDAIIGAVTAIAVAKIVAITMAITALVILWPLRRALTRRFDEVGDREAALRAELDDLRARVAELEERLDFTERVQAGRGEPERLGQGG